MKCPVCDSESYEILKTKGKNTKEYLLQCNDCGNTYRETVVIPKMVECRVIISKFEESFKKTIKIHPDDVLEVGEVLLLLQLLYLPLLQVNLHLSRYGKICGQRI
jgi:uncharacterized Zn finger protein